MADILIEVRDLYTAQGTQGLSTRLDMRVHVSDEECHLQSCDSVEIFLKGFVRARTGTNTSVEKIVERLETRPYSEFQMASAKKDSNAHQRYLDIDFMLPSQSATSKSDLKTGDSGSLIPSLSICGRAHSTRSAVPSDNDLLEGRCDVVYLVEVKFHQAANNKVIKRLISAVPLPSEQQPLDFRVFVMNQSQESQCTKETATFLFSPRSWLRRCQTRDLPMFRVYLGEGRAPAMTEQAEAASAGRVMTFPMAVTLTVHSEGWWNSIRTRSGDRHFLRDRQLRCKVRTHWHTRRSFTAGDRAGNGGRPNASADVIICNNTVAKQSRCLNLPPLYSQGRPAPEYDEAVRGHGGAAERATASHSYSTSSLLQLNLPDSTLVPSVDTRLLHVSHVLEAWIELEFDGAERLLPSCKTHMKLPVNLEAFLGSLRVAD